MGTENNEQVTEQVTTESGSKSVEQEKAGESNKAINIDPVLQNIDSDALLKVNELVNKARKQEKDKIYADIEKLKKQLGEQNKEKSQLIEEKQNLEKLLKKFVDNNEVGKETVQPKSDNMDIQQIREELKKEYESKLDLLTKEVKNISNSFNTKLTEFTLEKAKENLLKKYPDAIPEMIKGNTEEELEAQALSSIALKKKIFEQYEKEKQAKEANTPSIPPVNIPASSVEFEGQSYTYEDILNMSDKELADKINKGEFGDRLASVLDYKSMGMI